MEIIDRKTAIERGLTTYFTGKECHNGHISVRKVDSGSCSECKNEWTRRWREQGVSENYNPSGKPLPTQEYLLECFEYVYETGELVWKRRPVSHFKTTTASKSWHTQFVGKVAGHYHSRNGYLEIRLNKDLYKGHRIVWKLLRGTDPEGMLDHINGDVADNRIENLREATAQENSRNSNKRTGPDKSTSGYKGVAKAKGGKWLCVVTVGDKPLTTIHPTELDAAMHYDKTVLELFGEFASPNFPQEELKNRILATDVMERMGIEV